MNSGSRDINQNKAELTEPKNKDELRFTSPAKMESDSGEENILRPRNLQEFVGQKKNVENLHVFIQAARKRNESLDHVLFSGPPGLGKTTLAHIIAREMGKEIQSTSAPAIEKAGDLAAMLTSLEEGDILFIDEIHRLSTQVEEILYPAMEDGHIDIVIGQGPTAKSIQVNLKNFTLIGATTRPGLLSSPLTSRFGISMRLEYYSHEEMQRIVQRISRILAVEVELTAQEEIARRGRSTPRLVIRLLKRIRDFAQYYDEDRISLQRAKYALERLDIDELGLDQMDRKILSTIIEYYRGGPVGLKTLATAVGEDQDSLEDIYEPFLIQSGLLQRTNRGRIATPGAYQHLKIETPQDFDGLPFHK